MSAVEAIVWEYDSTCFPAGTVVQYEFHPHPRKPQPPPGFGWEMIGLCFGDGMLYAAWRRDATLLGQMQQKGKKR
mgnify:CR=1 FL=1